MIEPIQRNRVAPFSEGGRGDRGKGRKSRQKKQRVVKKARAERGIQERLGRNIDEHC